MQKSLSKSTILQHITKAKRSHINWVRSADKLVNGMNGFRGEMVEFNATESFIPLDSQACEFGMWFNTCSPDLSNIKSIGGLFTRIKAHHEDIHDTYEKIYTIFFVDTKKRSLARKIVTLNNKKVTKSERDKAKIYMAYLKSSSEELLAVLSILEDKVKSLAYSDINEVRKV